MKRAVFLCFFAVFSVFCGGCGERIIVNGVSYRVLSEAEEKEMLSFARVTLVNSGENLTAVQKNFILNTMPSIRLSYHGDKAGRASYEWIFNDEVMIRLNCEGEFLSSSMQVNTRKVKLQEEVKKGKSPVLERLTLKEVEF